METLFTWLHLADLQVRAPSAAPPAEALLANLREDLPARGRERIDAIVVTGDLAAGGRADEYDVAGAFLLDAARGAGLGRERVFVVPGNHDVDRQADQAAVTSKLLAELRQGRRRLDAAIEAPRARAVITARLQAFSAFAAAFGPDPADGAAPDELLWWSHGLAGRGGLRVRLLGLATGLLADGDADRGCLRLGEAQLREAEGTVREGELVLAASHHPARGGWLADEVDVEAWLRRHAHVHLTGHVHDPIAEEARAGAPGPFVWIAAGASRRKAGPSRRFGYAVASILRAPDGSLVARVAPRRWVPEERRFVPDDRALPDGQTFADRPLRLSMAKPAPPVRIPAPSRAPSGIPLPVPVPVPVPVPDLRIRKSGTGTGTGTGTGRNEAPTTPPPPAPQPSPTGVRAIAKAASIHPRPERAVHEPHRDPRREEPEPADADWIPPPRSARAPATPAPRPAPPATPPRRATPPAPRPVPPATPPRRAEAERPALFEGPNAMPALPIPYFAGRADDLVALRAALVDPGSTCVVATGMGGIGKTSLVQQLVALDARGLFAESAWVDARELTSELGRVARRLGLLTADRPPTLDEAVRFVRASLESRRLLLVIDNVNPGMADVRALPIPPAGSKSRTIITSRIVTLHEDLGKLARPIRLGAWDAAVARGHLREVAPSLASAPDDALDALTSRVGGLPLAVRLLARQLLRPDVTTTSLLGRLERDPLGALDGAARNGEPTVAATFQPSVDRLGPSERRLLIALAACAPATRAAVVAEVAGVREDEAALALEGMAEQSMVDWVPDDERPFRLHPVVRAVLGAQPGADTARTAHDRLVRALLEDHGDPNDWQGLELDVPEVLTAADRRLGRGDAAGAWETLKSVMSLLDRRGKAGDLVAAATRVLQAVPPESPIAAEVLGDLGLFWCSLGDLAKAEGALSRALALAEQQGSAEAQARALGGLGRCAALRGELEKAIGFHRRAATLHELLGKRQLYANDLGNVGLLHRRLGDVGDAIEQLERALAIHEKLGVSEGRAEVLGGLGLCFRDLGELPTAIEHFKQALDIHEELGRRAGQATMLGNLGNAYRTLGKLDEAIAHLESALSIYEELGLFDGQGTALGNLGSCYRARGDAPRARAHFERALAALRRMDLPDDHPHVKAVLAALAQPPPRRG